MEGMVSKDIPLVSVIMNCYNSAQFLAEAIDSVYAQTFKDWEIVFFDNCSADRSAAIAQDYDGHLKYYRSEKTIPLGAARNQALGHARGRYFAFLDCDDIWCPDKLERQVSLMEKDKSVGLVYSNALFFNDKGRSFLTFVRGNAPQGKIFASLLRKYILPMPTIMARRSALDQAGGWFDERFNMVEDADMFMRVAYHFPVGYIDEMLAKRRMHAQSWTLTKKELFPKEEEILLSKFASIWPSFENDFRSEIASRKAIISYQYAVLDWEQGKNSKARKRMRPHLAVMKKMWVPFMFSYLPIFFYNAFKRYYKTITASFMGSVDDQSF